MADHVAAYIASFPPEAQKQLEALRATIRAAAPAATERISYSIIGFFIGAQHVVYLGGWKHHISLYPIPKGTAAFEATRRAIAMPNRRCVFPSIRRRRTASSHGWSKPACANCAAARLLPPGRKSRRRPAERQILLAAWLATRNGAQ